MVKTKQDLIQIHLIEHYNYCPKQAENQMGNVKLWNTGMRDGIDYHESKANVRKSFWKSIRNGKEARPKYEVIKSAINNAIDSTKPAIFSEVFVESLECKMCGEIDEVQIGKGHVLLIEYKTSFNPNKLDFFVDSALLQVRAYAKAFLDFYGYTGKIFIAIVRAELSFENNLSFLIDEDEIVDIDENGFMICNGWKGMLHHEYDSEFHPDTDLKALLEICNKIRAREFPGTDNIKKCLKCQYNLSCNSTRLSRGRDETLEGYSKFMLDK